VRNKVQAVKKAMSSTEITAEDKEKRKGEALNAQKFLLALKTELKKETDKKQFALAAAKEKAQKDEDKKNEVKLDSKDKLAINKSMAKLADVSKKLTKDPKKDAEIRKEA